MVIPVQGEAPHGVFHIMHGGWHLYRRFIRVVADFVLRDQRNAVLDEVNVKAFNSSYFALCWMTRACSEYLLSLARTAGAVDIDMVPEFIRACEQNIGLAWVVHFLYDFAYRWFWISIRVLELIEAHALMYCGGNSFLLVALVLQTRQIMFQCRLCEFSGRML